MPEIRENITSLTIYTGSNGKKGCTCQCIGCSQEKYGLSHPFYQGKLEQIYDVLKVMPNLKRAIILGNPDPSVDPEFCNMVSKILIQKGVRVRFSTSGFHAVRTVEKLCGDLDPSMVDYVSFSIDTIEESGLAVLKGRIISLKELEEAVNWCKARGFRLKIQPTLWTVNLDECKKIIDFFYSMGITWFSFHAGSYETFAADATVQRHADPWEWRKMVEELGRYCQDSGISLHLPYLFLNDDEYAEYIHKNGEMCDIKKLKNTQIWLEDGYIRTTHCPLLNEVYPFQYNLLGSGRYSMDIPRESTGYCPISRQCLGKETAQRSVNEWGNEFVELGKERLHTICRFHNFTVNYPTL